MQPGDELTPFAENYYSPKQAQDILGIGKLELEYLADKGQLSRVRLQGYTKRFYLKEEVDALRRSWDEKAVPAGKLPEIEPLGFSKSLEAVMQGQRRLEKKLDTIDQRVEHSHADLMRQLAESTLQLQRLTERVEDHETRIARLERGRSVVPRLVVVPL